MLSAAQTLDEARKHGPSENCISPCSGNPDSYCGGPSANQLYTMPPIPPPTGTPAYKYMGCYQDDQVFDFDLGTDVPPMPIKRREFLA